MKRIVWIIFDAQDSSSTNTSVGSSQAVHALELFLTLCEAQRQRETGEKGQEGEKGMERGKYFPASFLPKS